MSSKWRRFEVLLPLQFNDGRDVPAEWASRHRKDLLECYNRGQWQSTAKLQEAIQQYQSYAAATMRASRLVTFYLSPEDVEAIQQRAVDKGILCQTFIANILHQFVAGRLVKQA